VRRRVWRHRGAEAARALCIASWLVVVLAGAPAVLGASPDPTAATVGDPRSSGQGPGLVGDPGAAIGLVLLVAGASVAITAAYLRFTAPKGPAKP
jgi:hypothetical protein